MFYLSKRICLIGMIVFVSCSLFAQGKPGIALGNSSNPARLSTGDLAMFEGAALMGIRQSDLCVPLERAEWEKILKERGIQKTEEFLDGKIVPQSASLGAEYLMVLSIQNYIVTDENTRSTKGVSTRSAEATILINANVISVVTGQIKHNKNFSLKASGSWIQGTGKYSASKDEIADSFKDELSKKAVWEFSQFMFDVFPPEIVILRIEEIKKDKAKTVLCKTSAKLPDNLDLDVFTEEVIDLGGGETSIRTKNFGKLKVKRVESDKLVFCEVKKGEETILQKFNAKEPMKCKADFRESFMEGLNIFKPKAKY